jgi:hypothetical protein
LLASDDFAVRLLATISFRARIGGANGSAGCALIPAQRNCSRTLQFMKQRPNIALRDAIASHKKSHR